MKDDDYYNRLSFLKSVYDVMRKRVVFTLDDISYDLSKEYDEILSRHNFSHYKDQLELLYDCNIKYNNKIKRFIIEKI